MPKKRVDTLSVQAPENAASLQTEYDLPPKGFVFFLLAQRADNKVTEAIAEAKIQEYFEQFSGRKLDDAKAEARMFLGRVTSVATNLLKGF